jgi:tetratricopeptide (TPR) repeat protein
VHRANARLLAVAALIGAGAMAYANSLLGPFVLDDPSSIVDNPTIRRIWPPWAAFAPPHGALTVSGRPLLNASLALNYALSGVDVRGYHIANLAIHILAALALFGLVRRILEITYRGGPWGSTLPAFALALIWEVHPLQTEAVTYVVQRAESLMGLFYLLTLYGFVRGAERQGSLPWLVASVTACLCGMATKEVMVSAPLVVLLCDIAVFSGGIRASLRARPSYYASLGATWAVLAYLVIANGDRGGTSGMDVAVGARGYWLVQFQGISHYLRLALWPCGQVFDYGVAWPVAANPWPYVMAMTVLFVLAVALCAKRSLLGLSWLAFFLLLAPTSLVPGNRQLLAEHRMYLALIAPIATGIIGFGQLAKFLPDPIRQRGGRPAGAVLVGVMGVGFGANTFARNQVYRTEIGLFGDTYEKCPRNEWAVVGLGQAFEHAGRGAEAMSFYGKSLVANPSQPRVEANLGDLLMRQRRIPEAIDHYEHAWKLAPNLQRIRVDLAVAEYSWGNSLCRERRYSDAIVHFERAVAEEPDFADCLNNLGIAESLAGFPAQGVSDIEKALSIRPDWPEARRNLSRAKARLAESTLK